MQQFKATLNQTVRRYTVVNNSVVRTYGVKYAGIKWRVGGIEDAPFTNLIYVRRNGAWTNLELSQYVEKNGTDRLITLEEINLFRSKQDALGFTPEVAGVAAQLVNALGYLLSDHTSDTTKHITTTERSNWNSAYNWGNHAEAGYLKSFTETDPVFMAWDKKTGILISKSQITDFPTSMPASDVYAWAKDINKPTYNYSEIGGTPTKLSQFLNDLGNYGGFVTGTPWTSVGYLTAITKAQVEAVLTGQISSHTHNYLSSFTETDPVFTAWNKSTGISIAKSQISDFPTSLSQFTNNLGNYGNWVVNTDSRLSDARTASDVYSWAKQASKPSYSWTEIGSRPTNLSQFVNDLGNYGSWITASALSSYLLLSGGTMSGKILTPSSGTGVYGGAFEIREREYVAANQYDWDYAPRITFHWGNRAAVAFGLRYDGQMAVDGNPISMSGHTHDYATHRGEGTNYIDNSYRLYDNYRGGWRTSDDLYVAYAYSAGSVPWGGVSGKPTTLGGYGISDWAYGDYGNVDNVSGQSGSFYFIGGSPIPGESDGTLWNHAYTHAPTTWGSQLVQNYRDGRIYVRGRNNGGWSGWLTMIDSGTIGSQSVNYAASANYATSANHLNSSNYIEQRGSQGNWNQDFYNTPAGTTSYGGDVGAVQSSNPGGSWWIQQNFRHTNASNYWGVQVAWGWEDNANRLATRSISGGSFGAWNYYLHSNNFTTWAAPVSHSHDYATHRGDGTNYIDYSRYVYNNGAYSGSGWCEPSDLGVRYAANAGTVGGYSYAQIIANIASSGVTMDTRSSSQVSAMHTLFSSSGKNVLIQYGTFKTNTTVTFDVPFPTACVAVICTHRELNYYECITAQSVTVNNFYGSNRFTNILANYIAIGY